VRVAAAVVLLIALAAAGWLLWSRATAPSSPAARLAERLVRQRRVVPTAELPPVEPVRFVSGLDREQAVAVNARVPFVRGGVVRAAPFRFAGGVEDRARAVTCLATAMIYEAGDEPVGQRSVAQVVLNRVRHPAYPKSVCGVVFQGTERTTGCQFTFACDGALARVPRPDVVARAEARAAEMIDGRVDASVGHATHYHTDWVVPYWSASLDKIARVRTHLFFRWTGWWGTPGAFRGRASGIEPVEPEIAALFAAHRAPDPAAETATPAEGALPGDAAAAAAAAGGTATSPLEETPTYAPSAANPNVFLALLPRSLSEARYVAVAERACAGRPTCVFMAWSPPSAAPADLPATTSQLQSMAFHYLRDPALPAPRARWNCAATPRKDRSECLSHQSG